MIKTKKLIQLCPTLCNPMDCSPSGSSVLGDSLGKNTGVSCHALLQGIFPTQGLNLGLPHYMQILYCLSHQGSPNTGRLAYSMKWQKDRTLKEELPRSVGAQYTTRDQWRNNYRKNEETEPKQKQHPVVDVTGDGSKV